MLDQLDLSQEIKKKEYHAGMDELEVELGRLQREAQRRGVPVIVLFEGLDAAGKTSLLTEMVALLDPRGFTVWEIDEPTEAEARHAWLWRFWTKIPARGRLALLHRSWYRRLLLDREVDKLSPVEVERVAEDIRGFERQLIDDGYLIVKLFLYIDAKEQDKRLDAVRKDPSLAWHLDAKKARRLPSHKRQVELAESALAATDTDQAPWTVVEAHDQRFATLKALRAIRDALRQAAGPADEGQARDEAQLAAEVAGEAPSSAAGDEESSGALDEMDLRSSILRGVDMSPSLDKDKYKGKLEAAQDRLRGLLHEAHTRGVRTVLVYEGWDAAGKGGNIRRLVRKLDPRYYDVVPVAAPNDEEKAHHWLWRFWRQMPDEGEMAIFDRSWYGRVLVERVEGFARADEWGRAYREINEMEGHLVDSGLVLVKFWLHIDRQEQLERFEARREDPDKQWKITEEDWRNREKWDQYLRAVDEMLRRTSTPAAPWTVVASNSKRYARVEAIRTVCDALEKRL